MTTNDLTIPAATRVSARALLTGGVVAGPLYVAVWLGQAFTREGFDLTRHPASLLANGGPGWIQTANFVISGLLSIGAAIGLRRTLTGRGSTWAPGPAPPSSPSASRWFSAGPGSQPSAPTSVATPD